ncbi:hypothetical protein BVRB_5g104770 isoform A [Beta vulgaris subsp. vulgaris]|nr:hypothetical protein BVRB_5g104770 isoform A [Beta vulgaris subsp. vulgaris]
MWMNLELGLLLLYVMLMIGLILWWWNEIWYVSIVKARCSIFNTKLPPGHLGFPFIGETFSFYWFFNKTRRPDDFINLKKHKYGENVGVYRTYLYGSPSIIACSPTICKLVLNSSDKFKQEWPTTEVLGSNSVITLQGPRHTVIKSFIVNSINRPDSLTRFLLQVQPDIVDALQHWSQEPKITAFRQLRKVTLGYTMRHFSGFEAKFEQIDAFEHLFEGITNGMRALPWNFPGTTYHHALKCRKKITMKFKEEIEKRRQNNNNGGGLETTSDLIHGLMQMEDKEGRQLSEEEVLDNIVSTIHIGHISVAYLVTWSLYFVDKSPHVLQKLQEENRDMSRQKNGGHITYEDIMQLKYTNKVIEETIRMANLSGFVFRKATEDIEFQGYLVPKGWRVIVWLRYLHTDPSNFEDPMTFNPDRWDMRPKNGTYLPFGGGPRSCPGYMLARLSLAIFLHHLSVGYKWELLNPNARISYFSHPLPTDGLEICLNKN